MRSSGANILSTISETSEEANTRVKLLSNNDRNELIKDLNGLIALDINPSHPIIFDTLLHYAEKKLRTPKSMAPDKIIDKMLPWLFSTDLFSLEIMIELVGMTLKEINRLEQYLKDANAICKADGDFFKYALSHIKEARMAKANLIELTDGPSAEIEGRKEFSTTAGITFFVETKEEGQSGSFGTVKKAYKTPINDNEPQYALKTHSAAVASRYGLDCKKIAKKEAKYNAALQRESFLVADKTNHRLLNLYTWQSGKTLADPSQKKGWLEIPLANRLLAILDLLKQLTILQDKNRIHADHKLQNVIFDKQNCRLSIIDFGMARKFKSPEDRFSNLSFLKIVMKELLPESSLRQRFEACASYDEFTILKRAKIVKEHKQYESREKLFQEGTPIENAIVRLWWAIDPQDIDNVNAKCPFARAILFLEGVLHKKDELNEQDVINIANEILYDETITFNDLVNGKKEVLRP